MYDFNGSPFDGGSFDDFLREEGILEEVEAGAIKKLIAYGLMDEIKKQNMTKTELADKMHTSRAAVNRLLDPDNSSVTLNTISNAANVLGKKVSIEIK